MSKNILKIEKLPNEQGYFGSFGGNYLPEG